VAEVARTISALIGETDRATLLDYLPRMENHALAQRLGLILERLSTVQEIEEDLIAGITRQVGEHIYPLDPHEPEAGVLDNRWRIRENVDVLGEL
jgi:predicted transcriptional regulator of viral defense system